MLSVIASVALLPVPFPTAFPAFGTGSVQVVQSVRPENPFDEAIVSWNVANAENGTIEVEARGRRGDTATPWYRLGVWSLDPSAPKHSSDHQEDDAADVLTDTLRFKATQEQLDVRLTLKTHREGAKPVLKLVTASLINRQIALAADSAAPSQAWGTLVDAPQRAQGNYPRGNVLCSPTSLSMLLWHWANQTSRPDLNRDVPEVEAAVWDPVYRGAGNWPFNTAYAGSFPEMTSYVSRFTAISDLEAWIAAGLPVICSVSFDLLRGKPLSPNEQGHLVLVVGFDAQGNVVMNDPAFREQVRRTVPRADFERAWSYSRRTVYVVHPSGAKVPTLAGPWLKMD